MMSHVEAPQLPVKSMKNHRQCGGPASELSPSSRTQHRAIQAILSTQNQQLRANIQRLRAARVPGADPGLVDASFDEYAALRGVCMEMARALAGSSAGGDGDDNDDDDDDDGDVDALRASFGGLNIADPVVPIPKAHQATLDEYRDFVSKLAHQHRTSLLETYQAYFRQPLSPETITCFLRNTHFHAEALHKMRNATTTLRNFSAAPTY